MKVTAGTLGGRVSLRAVGVSVVIPVLGLAACLCSGWAVGETRGGTSHGNEGRGVTTECGPPAKGRAG